MLESALSGLLLVMQWPAFGYLLLGVVIGIYFGAVPGLSGLVGMAILLPFTFKMDPVSAIAFLLGMFAVTTTSDTLASILLGIPGTAASQATILDGYPLAMQGEAARAFGAAFTVSALGGVAGGILLGVSIPVVRPLILSLGVAEFFMLAVLGLTMVGSLSGGSVLNGLIAAALGLFLSMVGYSPNGAVPRYWFDVVYLLEGLPLVPLVLGLFALPELLDLAVKDTSISRVPKEKVQRGMLRGIREAFTHWWLVLRCTLIGAYVGMLPGLGGAIVDWVAYGHVVQSSRDKSLFGKGDIRGVIAPETANNAMKGGALIPTVAFGIPGSAPMAILLGAFLIHGLEPGPQMLTQKLNITFTLVWTLVIANILGSALLLMWGNQLAKVTFIRGHLIIPAVALFVFMGAWTTGNTIGDWIILLAFGVTGYLMKQGGIPRPPLILGFILGPIMENSLYLTTQYFGPVGWLLRPICIVLLVLVVGTVAYSVWKASPKTSKPEGFQTFESEAGDPFISLLLMAVVFLVLGAGTMQALSWPREVGLFPLAIGVPGSVITLIGLGRALYVVRSEIREGSKAWGLSREVSRAAFFFAWLFGILVASVVVGQQIALPLLMAVYLRAWGGYGWTLAVTYGVGGWLFLYLMFEKVIQVVWYPALLSL